MYKVRFKERLFIIFFACFLAIYPPIVKYQEVQALEWVAPVVGFETALKFLLGIIGVKIASDIGSEMDYHWNDYVSDCQTFQQNQGNSAVAVSKWWNDIIDGTLDQTSACWTSFKEWVNAKLHPASANDGTLDNKSIKEIIEMTGNSISDYGLDSNFSVVNTIVSPTCITYSPSNANKSLIIYVSDGTATFTEKDGFLKVSFSSTCTRYMFYVGSSYGVDTLPKNVSVNLAFINSITYPFYMYGYITGFDSVTVTPWSELTGGTAESEFESATSVPATDIDLTTENTTDTAIPDTIPLPWENAGAEDTAISDTYDDLAEQVNEGVLSIEGFMEGLQELLGVMAIDTTNDEILPHKKDDDGNNETLDDKASENTSNYGFTLAGLEKVFPFCIPWDIYAFVTILVAEPVAPVIEYPILNPATRENEIIRIDFENWRPIVTLFRYIFDFLLIIGLLLLARSLAGAGGDD